MNISKEKIKTGWMTWEEIERYSQQLIDLELELMIKHHYPDWDIPRTYPESRVQMLKEHLKSGNTFFWGATYDNELVGYYWAYTAPFIDKKRWVLRSLMIRDEYQNLGLGSLAISEGIEMAKKVGCDEAVTEYVPHNKGAANAYAKAGYEISRIEVLKKL